MPDAIGLSASPAARIADGTNIRQLAKVDNTGALLVTEAAAIETSENAPLIELLTAILVEMQTQTLILAEGLNVQTPIESYRADALAVSDPTIFVLTNQ